MNAITVSALSAHIVMMFEQNEQMRDVWVLGEVSNWRQASSGHIYFVLKDRGASISSVMWRSHAQGQSWLPREGDQILVHGYVGVYSERGVYQLYANAMQPAGRGQLYQQFEQLKTRLTSEGLFDSERKRPLPVVVRRVGVITSAAAAALRDILHVLSMRWPLVDVLLFPTPVQGAGAAESIADAIENANRYNDEVEDIQVLLVARGGGSIEDLWQFNEERVAYAIVASRIPVVSGIGHETDFTIADFAADVRAPTPSAAAAAIVPDRSDVLMRLYASLRWLSQTLNGKLEREQQTVELAFGRLRRVHPQRRIDQSRGSLDDRERQLDRSIRQRLRSAARQTEAATSQLEALSPHHVLRRGYSIVRRARDGDIVRGPEDLTPNARLEIQGQGGEYQADYVAHTE